MTSSCYNPRVGASEGTHRWDSPTVYLNTRPSYGDSNVYVTFTPSEARAIARKLKRFADFVDPPKPRRRRA